MDDINAIASLLQNGAFPIAMVVILCWYIKYMMDKFEKVLTELKTSIDKLSTRVDTIVDMQKGNKDDV